MKPNTIILYIIVLAVAFCNFDTQWAYTADSAWWTHLTFHFAHGNIFHLAANMLVLFLLLPFNGGKDWWLCPLCYALATACSFIICTSKPTLGLSGLLFAYYGILFFKDGVKWRSLHTTLIYMAVSCVFVSRMAVGLHLLCLAAGCLVGLLMLWIDNIKRKEKMYG